MTYVIGIDSAAQDSKCGLALGALNADRVTLLEVATKQKSVLPTLLRWVRDHEPAIIAMDAPLGWPDLMGPSLISHEAGQPIAPSANALFRRETDRVVRERTGKQPMEVGAEKIARAALRAVKLIGELREATGYALPLPLTSGIPDQPTMIEVYPALTLRSRAISDRGYKGNKAHHREQRLRLLDEVGPHINLPADPSLLVESDDAFDAMVCLLAAADFCGGNVVAPTDVDRAKKEGWIWFRTAEDELGDM